MGKGVCYDRGMLSTQRCSPNRGIGQESVNYRGTLNYETEMHCPGKLSHEPLSNKISSCLAIG